MKRRWFALEEERGRLTVKMTAKKKLPMQHQSQEKPTREKPKRGMPKKRRGKVISAAWSIPSLAPLPPLQSRHHLLLHAHAHAPGTPTTTYFCLMSDEEMMNPGNRMRIILPSLGWRGRRTRCPPWGRSRWGRGGTLKSGNFFRGGDPSLDVLERRYFYYLLFRQAMRGDPSCKGREHCNALWRKKRPLIPR